VSLYAECSGFGQINSVVSLTEAPPYGSFCAILRKSLTKPYVYTPRHGVIHSYILRLDHSGFSTEYVRIRMLAAQF